jgi:LacI family transcriptional regulator
VLAGRPIGECPFAWVETRHEEGMRAPVEHLASLGHERVAFFGGRADFEHVQVRRERWSEAIEAAGVEEGRIVHADDREAA